MTNFIWDRETAVINALYEEGTKVETIWWLQKTRNELCVANARVAELEKAALGHDLNIADEELLRIRNKCELMGLADNPANIWGRMIQQIVDAVRHARATLEGKQP